MCCFVGDVVVVVEWMVGIGCLGWCWVGVFGVCYFVDEGDG